MSNYVISDLPKSIWDNSKLKYTTALHPKGMSLANKRKKNTKFQLIAVVIYSCNPYTVQEAFKQNYAKKFPEQECILSKPDA